MKHGSKGETALKSRYWMAFAAVFLPGPGVPFPAAHAGTACESEAVLKYLPRGCQRQRIQATGGLTFGVVRSAGGRARRAWQRQVVFLFGERYQDWEMAACKKVFCTRATFAGSRRCTYSAFPCAQDTDPEALAALTTRQIGPDGAGGGGEPLTTAGVKEIQELLRKVGFRVWVDGIPGEQTEQALARWQRKRGLAGGGRLNRASLEMLRHAYAASRGTGSR
jgi:Putative peptidoglycan binding domain